MRVGHRCVRMDTTRIIPTLAPPMATMGHSGLRAEYSLVPDLGITGVMVDTMAAPGTGAAATDAKAGAMSADGSMRAVATNEATPGAMPAGATDAAITTTAGTDE